MATSRTHQPTPFPPELIDLIIDHCCEDKATLASCSLVCKSWLPSSRYHLFSTVEINSGNLSGILHLLDRPSYPIAPLVRQLELCSLSATEWEGLRLRLKDLSQEMRDSRLSTFTSLTSLDLHYLWFRTFDEVAALISLFPLVQNLVISGSWEVHILPPPNTHRPPSHLRSLELSCWSSDVLNWLALHDPIPCVQILVLHHIGMVEFSAIREYLRAAALTLRHLALDFADERAKAAFCTNIDLSHNIELRSISIDGDLTLIGDILSQIRSQHMEVVKANVSLLDDIDAPPWAHLDNVMAQPQFLRLQRMEFRCPERGWVAGDIQQRLPATHARGIFHFDDYVQ